MSDETVKDAPPQKPMTIEQLRHEKASLVKQAEDAHHKWLTALGAIDFIDYQLNNYAWLSVTATETGGEKK